MPRSQGARCEYVSLQPNMQWAPACRSIFDRFVRGSALCDGHAVVVARRKGEVDLEDRVRCRRCQDVHRTVNTLQACLEGYARGSLPRSEEEAYRWRGVLAALARHPTVGRVPGDAPAVVSADPPAPAEAQGV